MIHISMSHNPQQHLHVFCFFVIVSFHPQIHCQHHISMIYFDALQHNFLVFPLFTFALNVVMLYAFTRHEAYLMYINFKVADCSVHWHTLQCFILHRVCCFIAHYQSFYTAQNLKNKTNKKTTIACIKLLKRVNDTIIFDIYITDL